MSGWLEDLREAFEAGRDQNLTFEQWVDGSRWASIDDLDLPVRLYNAMCRAGIRTVADARVSLDHHGNHLDVPFALDLYGIGWRTYEEGRAMLAEWDRRLAESRQVV